MTTRTRKKKPPPLSDDQLGELCTHALNTAYDVLFDAANGHENIAKEYFRRMLVEGMVGHFSKTYFDYDVVRATRTAMDINEELLMEFGTDFVVVALDGELPEIEKAMLAKRREEEETP